MTESSEGDAVAQKPNFKPRSIVPSEEDKARALKDVRYELGMMAECALAICDVPFTPAPFLESLLLHVRSVRDFFEKSQGKMIGGVEQDDVLFRDYGFDPLKLDLPTELRDLLNKDLSHLSYSRSGPMWKLKEFLPPLIKESQTFCDFVLRGDGRKYLSGRDKETQEQILLWENTERALRMLSRSLNA